LIGKRIAKCLLDVFGDGAALAGDQCRGDAAGRTRQHGTDPRRHLGAQPPQRLAPAVLVRRPRQAVRGAVAVADAADPGEVEVALEVAPARQYRRRHRIEPAFEADPVAGFEPVARRRDVQSQSAWGRRGAKAGQRIGSEDDAPAPLRPVDVDDPPGHLERPEPAPDDGGHALGGGLGNQHEPGGEYGQQQRRLEPRRPPPQQESERNAEHDRGHPRPQRRFETQGEIERDAAAERDRQPQPSPLSFGSERLGELAREAPAPIRRRAEPTARDRPIRHRRPPLARCERNSEADRAIVVRALPPDTARARHRARRT
jgi:hypothetical protein